MMTDDKEMTFEELASAYFALKEKSAEQEITIKDYEKRMEDYETSVKERDERISHLQTIIVDHVGTSERPKDKGSPVFQSFNDRYKAMIQANTNKE